MNLYALKLALTDHVYSTHNSEDPYNAMFGVHDEWTLLIYY